MGENQNGLSTAVFDWVDVEAGPPLCNLVPQLNVQTISQHSHGPTRTELAPEGWFQPYRMPCAQANEYRNAEAGLSTFV